MGGSAVLGDRDFGSNLKEWISRAAPWGSPSVTRRKPPRPSIKFKERAVLKHNSKFHAMVKFSTHIEQALFSGRSVHLKRSWMHPKETNESETCCWQGVSPRRLFFRPNWPPQGLTRVVIISPSTSNLTADPFVARKAG